MSLLFHVCSLSLVLVATFLLRVVPGLRWRHNNPDAGYHLLLRREIRRNHMRMPYTIPALMLDEKQNYPWLYHWFLAFLPDKLVVGCPPFASALSDMLLASLAYALAAWLAPTVSSGITPWLAGMLAGLLVGSTPALLAVGIGPRSYEITARPFGELIFAIAMSCSGLFLLNGFMWAGVGAAVTAGLVLLSSLFGAQVLIFCVPAMALFTRNWPILLVPLTGIAVAMILSRGRYWNIVKAQIMYLDLYRRRIQRDHDALVFRNDWRKIARQIYSSLRSGGHWRARSYNALSHLEYSTPFQLLFRNYLWLGCIAGLFLWQPSWHEAEGWRRWLLAWTLAPVFPFLIASLRNFLFLGEAERYIEYAMVPAGVLASIRLLSLSPGLAAVILIAYAGVTFLVLQYYYKRLKNRMSPSSLDEFGGLISYLRSLPEQSIHLAIPHWLAFQCAWQLDQRFLALMDLEVRSRDWDRIFWRYPLPTNDLDWWRSKFGVQYIILDKGNLKKLCKLHKTDFQYNFTKFTAIFENAAYTVYRSTEVA